MYSNLGIHWASSVPAFLALACVPFPFIFWKYGPAIRARCKYAAEAAAFLQKMQNQAQEDETTEEEGIQSEDAADKEKEYREEREEEEQEAIDYSYEPAEQQPQFERIRTMQSRPSVAMTRMKSYEGNPFDLDRINTKESFRWETRSAESGRPGGLSRTNSKASRTSRK